MFSPISRRSIDWTSEHRVQVHDPRLEHLPPAEREELARQGGTAVGRPADLLHASRLRPVGRQGSQEQVAVARDDIQEVVEVVGHAGGELADGLELLGLQELRLEPLALGDVVGDDEPPGAAAELDVVSDDLHVDEPAVLRLVPPGP